MDFRFKVSPLAEQDLDQIWRHIAKDSPTNASDFCRRLLDAADSLTQLPHRQPIMRSRKETRRLPFEAYVVIYRVNEKTHTVEILRFWHAARDQERLRLKEDIGNSYGVAKLSA